MITIRMFNTIDDAMEYRYTNGTGGWIFSPEDEPASNHYIDRLNVILFSPDFTPTMIFNHPLTKGRSGKLISQ